MAIDDPTYRDWIARFDTFDAGRTEGARRFAATLPSAPRVDVVMPVFDPPEAFLRAAIASVRSQIYENWTLCIADDGSKERYVGRILADAAREDSRIRVHWGKGNAGTARATNEAIALGTGEFVAFVDHDDVIPPHALLLVADRVVTAPETNLLYSDFDFLDESGGRTNPFFKPDYDHLVHCGLNLVSHLTVHRRTVLSELGGLRTGFPGSQDYDLGLRVVEKIPETTIEHIPHVLYHWRIVPGSQARANLSLAVESARRAVKEHAERRGQAVSIAGTPRSLIWNRVRQLPRDALTVTLASDGGTDEAADAVLARHSNATAYGGLRVSRVEPRAVGSVAPFRNEVLRTATTDLVAFVDARFTPRRPDWLTEMASHFASPECAVVGARTIGFDGRTEQCGLVLGLRDPRSSSPIGRALHGLLESDPSYFGRDEMTRRASAVSGGAIVVRKSIMDAIGGFDERLRTPVSLDVDVCLRAGGRGASVVFCPHAVFVASSPPPLEPASEMEGTLLEKWGADLFTDRFYNPNLSVAAGDFGLAFPPRARFPWELGG